MSQNNSENTQQDDLPKGQADDASLPQETLSGDSANDGTGGANLDLVLDIPITVSMEIGRTKMRIKDLLNLSSGSIVELQKMVDEPLDLGKIQ